MSKDESNRRGNPRQVNPGDRFGHLVVIEEIEQHKGKYRRFVFRCDYKGCGNTKAVILGNAVLGRTTSCGCLRKETISNINKKYGLKKSREYNSWSKMKSRCRNPKNPDYPDYGGRGITYCDRWEKFENFFVDMGSSPGVGYSIHRKGDGNYEPGNCVWATAKVQARDRRNTVFATIFGVKKPLIEWCEFYKMPYPRVLERIRVEGWEPLRALTTPIIIGKNQYSS